MVKIYDVVKKYKIGEQEIIANDHIDFEVKQGELCVILGPSGAGKTTILNILGGMDTVTSGTILIDGKDITKFNSKALTKYRRHDVGFVFQFYNLMPQLTALDNVEIASEIGKDPLDAKTVLTKVGLSNRLNNFPSQLSGGEQQRVSIARAIAKNPKILLCDEPTGALDIETGKQILQLLYDTSKNFDKTVIIVTHNQAIAQIADRVIQVKNGKVSSNIHQNNPKKIDEVVW